MPYIAAEERHALTPPVARTPGELAYVIQQAIQGYLLTREPRSRYADFATVLGVLTSMQLDVHSRLLERYEMRRRVQHGDVWHPTLLDE
jgi:hypothetical protein